MIVSVKSAKGINVDLDKKVKFLEENPYIYQCIEGNNELRRFFIDKYVVIYKIEGSNVIILRMLPQRSNYKRKNLNILKLKF